MFSINRSLRRTAALAAAFAAAAAAPAPAPAYPTAPAPPQSRAVLITGATLHLVTAERGAAAEVVPDAKLLFERGVISRILGGKATIELRGATELIDLTGKHIYPGLIDANTVLGLVEINAVRATRDMAEPGPVNPNARAEVAVNPDSELVPVARANGVLAVLSVPQPSGGGLVAGTSALMQLDGWTWEDMTVKAPVGLHIAWPRLRLGGGSDEDQKKRAEAAAERVEALEKAFDDARAYRRALRSPAGVKAVDLRWEALVPVLEGKVPVFAHANDLAQIRGALHFAAEQEVKLVIVGGQDAWRVAPLLAQRDVAVVVSPVQALPLRRWEPYDTPLTNPLKLHQAGVRFCIAGRGNAFSAPMVRNLPYQAAQAAAHGLPPAEALKAVTLYPAQILGVDARLGSIAEGKDATFIVTDGDPLEVRTQIEAAYIGGRPVDLSSRHTRLYDKYREKYRQLREAGGGGAGAGDEGR